MQMETARLVNLALAIACSRSESRERNHCAGVTGAIVNTTATVASTSWAPGWTVVGVDGAPVALGRPLGCAGCHDT